jgi:hypothetical protein
LKTKILHLQTELAVGRASPTDVHKKRHPFQIPPTNDTRQRSGSGSGAIRSHVSLAEFTNTSSYTSFSLASMDEIPYIDNYPITTLYQYLLFFSQGLHL